MSVRIHTTGTDPLRKVPRTAWQAERERGVILPMAQPARDQSRHRFTVAAVGALLTLFMLVAPMVFS
jgi:hypothetical protein